MTQSLTFACAKSWGGGENHEDISQYAKYGTKKEAKNMEEREVWEQARGNHLWQPIIYLVARLKA